MSDTSFSIPVDLNAKIQTEVHYVDHGPSEFGDGIEEVDSNERTLGEIIAHETASRLASSISQMGSFGGSYSTHGVRLDKIIEDQLKESVEARVNHLVDARVAKAIIAQGQRLEDARVKRYNDAVRRDNSRWHSSDEDGKTPEIEATVIETTDQAVDLLVKEWFDTTIEDRTVRQYGGGYGNGTRLEVKVKEALTPFATVSADKYLEGLKSELKEQYVQSMEDTAQKIRKAAQKTLGEALEFATIKTEEDQ